MDSRSDTFLLGLAAGLMLGGLAMYIFDPQQGRGRRAMARDKAVRYSREATDYVAGTAKDLKNRAYGVAKEAEGMFREQVGTEPQP